MQSHYNLFSNSGSFYVPTTINYYTVIPLTPMTPTTPESFQSYDYFTSRNFCLTPSFVESNQNINHNILPNPFLLKKVEDRQNVILQTNQIQQSIDQNQSDSQIENQQNQILIKKQKENVDENICSINILRRKQKLIQKKAKDKINEKQIDNQYLPWGKKQKKAAIKYQENENRNIVPNQVNQIISFVSKQNKSGYLVDKIFKKYSPPSCCSIKRYYLYQRLLKNKLGIYSNQKSLKIFTELFEPKCESWSQQQQRYYNKISRILIHHFLYQDSIFIILTSKRMKREKKKAHIQARRFLTNQIISIIKGH